MTEFLFVRHCETDMNTHPDIVGGRSNSAPISKRGRQQSELLGNYLRDIHMNPDAVYTSGAVRTHMTAMLALGNAGLSHRLIVDPGLLELSQGTYEGTSRTTAYTPESIQTYNLESLDGKFPEGESIRDVQERMWHYLERAHDKHPDGELLVFSHGLAIRALAGFIQGQSKSEILAATTDNVSVTQIVMNEHGTYVDFVGENVIDKVE